MRGCKSHVLMSSQEHLLSANLKQPCEDVKLKHRDEVVTRQINGWLESHGLHPLLKWMHSSQLLFKIIPRHYAPVRAQNEPNVKQSKTQSVQPENMTHTCYQKTVSKTPLLCSLSACRCHPESTPLETWPSAPTAYDWTAGTVWWDSS